jgi:hypothetical protein
MPARPLAIASLLFVSICYAFAADARLTGRLTDTQEKPVSGAKLRLSVVSVQTTMSATSDPDGRFIFQVVSPGEYELSATAPGFSDIKKPVHIGENEGAPILDLRFTSLAARSDAVTVVADVQNIDVQSPDPAMKVFASEDLLDANPGRPVAPISIPGYPIETASSGIKAPQYFAPGVAGDHGESIAMFIQVGSYLVPNNLSANAHGNGYTDPFVIFIGDYRDATVTAGLSPSQNSWVAIEGSYGNGFTSRSATTRCSVQQSLGVGLEKEG